MPKSLRRALALFPYVILAAAGALLWREVRGVDWALFFRELEHFAPGQIAAAIGLVIVHYLLLSAYDVIALNQLGERISFPRVLYTSSVACAISNLVGHSVVTGMSPRLSHYRELSLSKLTQLMVMNIESWWAGFAFLFGLILVFVPVTDLQAYSQYLSVAGGGGLLSLIAIYLFMCWRSKGSTWRIGRAVIYLPNIRLGLLKVLVGALDTLMLSLTFYVLLPKAASIGFGHFIALHLSAHFLGVIAMVPAGFGVLEGVLLKLLEPFGTAESFLASILLFRLVHYVLPAGLAVIAETAGAWRRR